MRPCRMRLTPCSFCSYFVLMTQVIDTLGKAARHGMIVRVECASCGKRKFFRAIDLATVYGGGRDPRRLNFTCKPCRPKIEITVLEVDRDRMPSLVVWRPTYDREGKLRDWMPERL